MEEEKVYLGIDIGKEVLEAALPGQASRSLSNDRRGYEELLRWVQTVRGGVQVVCEASGGYERRLGPALQEGGVKVWSRPAGSGNLPGPVGYGPRPIGSTPSYSALMPEPSSRP